jgi:xylonate dehydratase
VLVPGGVTLLPEEGDDAGRVQSIGVRFVHREISLQEAADLGCRACASPGGGCQFLGTAATSQVVGEALGMSLGHARSRRPAIPSGSTWRGAPRAR